MPVSKRFAGLHGNLPEHQLPQRLHRRFDMVFFTHGHATAGDNQVVLLRGGFERIHRGFPPIRNNAEVAHLATHAVQQSPQEKTVGVVNGPRPHVCRCDIAGHDQLIAC
jgi:hypothetical protein